MPLHPQAKELPAWFRQFGGAAAARQYLGAQIAFTPTLARMPFSILELGADGARWIERGACRP